jgi:heat shock protein HslJ
MRFVPAPRFAAPLGASLLALSLAGCGKKPAEPAAAVPAGPPPTPPLEQVKSATISGVFEQGVTLANGRYEGQPYEPGAASRPALLLWDSTFHTADLDGTPGSEAVAMLSASTGGSGEMVYLAAFGMRDGQLANLGTVQVGDRTRLQSLWLERGKVVMDVIEAGPEDAACCPTQVTRKSFGYDGGAFKQLTSDVRGVLALSMLAANEWTLVEMNGQPLPAGVEPPLVHFEGNSVRGFAGCNRFSAPVKEVKPGELDVGAAVATKKACPPERMALEAEFLKQLDAVNRYGYLAGQLALTWQDGDASGTLLLRK